MESTEKDKKTSEDKNQLMVFSLDEKEFAFRLSELQEVINLPMITPIPGTSDFITGIFNLRGKIIVALDLKKRFAIGSAEKTQEKHVIVASTAAGTFGAMVDRVMGIISMKDSMNLDDYKDLKISPEFVEGVVAMNEPGRQIILLNIGKLLSENDLDSVNG